MNQPTQKEIKQVAISNKFRWLAKYIPCFVLHNFEFENDNACYGFRCAKCNKYILVRDLTNSPTLTQSEYNI